MKSVKRESKTHAWVVISNGCNNFCSYCIVPFTRGREKSRTTKEIVGDVARLVTSGVREVMLLGQNVNSFGNTNGESFPALLHAINADPGCSALKRIRFTSSHPLDFSDDLVSCFSKSGPCSVGRLAEHLHLPVQSGSNRILQLMGRNHKIEDYIQKMKRLRDLSPDIGLSTDLIVGFPSESDADFNDTLSLLDQVQFDSIYAFAYSPRPGTKAAEMPDDVAPAIKNERLNKVLKHQLGIAEKRYASRVGKLMEVLVEGEAKNQGMNHSKGSDSKAIIWSGRTSCNRVVNFAAEGVDLRGKFVNVKITNATSLSLHGEIVK